MLRECSFAIRGIRGGGGLIEIARGYFCLVVILGIKSWDAFLWELVCRIFSLILVLENVLLWLNSE